MGEVQVHDEGGEVHVHDEVLIHDEGGDGDVDHKEVVQVLLRRIAS